MKKVLLFIVVIGLALGCEGRRPVKAQKKDSTRVLLDSLTINLENIEKQGTIVGFGVSLVTADSILYEKGFGQMDIGSRKPYSPNTIQNIGSISKTFIGIGLLKAVEMGKLKLDDPVNEYLPFEVVNPYFPDSPITVRQLSNHTSSIQDGELYDEKSYIIWDDNWDGDRSAVNEVLNARDSLIPFSEFLPKLLDKKGVFYDPGIYLNQKPGTLFEYSNLGATLAALVLEEATDTPFDQFITAHVLQPIDMQTSTWSLVQIDPEQHSVLYAAPEKEIPLYTLITYPDGGLRSTVHDMSRYLMELIRAKSGKGQLLKPDSYSEYFQPRLDSTNFKEERDADFPFNDEYNFGVFIGHSGTGNIGHTGGDPGISSVMFFNPETETGLYCVINTSLANEASVDAFTSILRLLYQTERELSEER